ncbi:MAG: complex I NDUFA9 subunit family protein [Alphaproteobacteria bacterium]|nr:complex I NDUFA9 subunit family protein [Alphaproteobacteria bacterium]
MSRRVATVFGGSGFIGRHVVRRLAADGWVVRVAVRDPEAANFLKPMGDVEQIVPVRADIGDPESVRRAVHGAEAVVSLVGILYERGRRGFQAVHVEGAANSARAAAEAGSAALVHISALGADAKSGSAYARSKAAGEAAVRAAFPKATILRPSVVFGPEDDFFNRFAKLSSFTPVLPVFTKDGLKPHGLSIDFFGSGGPKFQPVYVGDVADAVMVAIRDSRAHGGKTYELGGPTVYSMKRIMELVLEFTDRRRLLVPLPFMVGRIQAAFLKYLPSPPLTPDQMRLMETDNVLTGGTPGLEALGVEPTNAEAILPQYLARYRAIEEQPTSRIRRGK